MNPRAVCSFLSSFQLPLAWKYGSEPASLLERNMATGKLAVEWFITRPSNCTLPFFHVPS